MVDADSLAEVLADPALFEPQRVNKGFAGAYFVLREAGIDTRLVDLVHRLTFAPQGDDLTAVALTLADSRPLDTVAVADNLRAYQWFLDRANCGGIPLTTAGYLKPTDVEEASKVVPQLMIGSASAIARSNATHCCGSAKACSRWDCCASTRAYCCSPRLA